MPAYLVAFDRPVIYQPDHPKVKRPITELPVRAPTAEGARAHAYRVTQGEAILTVTEVSDFVGPAPRSETPHDVPQFIDAAHAGTGVP